MLLNGVDRLLVIHRSGVWYFILLDERQQQIVIAIITQHRKFLLDHGETSAVHIHGGDVVGCSCHGRTGSKPLDE